MSQLAIPDAVQLINHKNAVVIDSRSKEQYQKGHIIDAQSIPQHEIQLKKQFV